MESCIFLSSFLHFTSIGAMVFKPSLSTDCPEQWEEKESSDGSVRIAAVQDVAAILSFHPQDLCSLLNRCCCGALQKNIENKRKGKKGSKPCRHGDPGGSPMYSA